MSENRRNEAEKEMQQDIDEVMRKYDRESNVRIWEGKPRIVVNLILGLFALWSIYVTIFATFLEEIRLTSFMGMIVFLGFLLYPAKKGKQKVNHMPVYDVILMVVTSAAFFYFTFFANEIVNQGTRFAWYQIVIGIIGIIGLVEVTRRCVGLPILFVAGFFVLYALTYGLTNPDFFLKVRYFIRNLFYTKEGIFSTPLNVCSKYIVVFIIFGAFLERIGISAFFIELANCIAGRFAGGPAKVAVISSALCGMVSGSSVGNTVTTGSVTIPMMKKTGYSPEFAGAVESGFLHRRADYAADYGCSSLSDGRLCRGTLCKYCLQGNSSGNIVFCGYFYLCASGSQEAEPEGNLPAGNSEAGASDEKDLSAASSCHAGCLGIRKLHDYAEGGNLCDFLKYSGQSVS